MPGYDTLVNALETRFDFHSARVLAHEAVVGAGLAEDANWSEDDLRLAAEHIPKRRDRDLTPVYERLGLASSEDKPAATDDGETRN